MACSIDENNSEEFYRACLKAHDVKLSDSETEPENGDFDETYFKLKPPPVPYSRIKNDIVKINCGLGPQTQKKGNERNTYASNFSRTPENEKDENVIRFAVANRTDFREKNDERVKKKKKKKRKRNRTRKRKKELDLRDTSFVEQANVPNAPGRQESTIPNGKLPDDQEMLKNAKFLIYQGERNRQEEPIGLLDENERMLKSTRQKQTYNMSMSSTVYDGRISNEMKVQTCQREINVQRDVKFLENVGMSKPTCQQPTYMSMPSTIYDDRISNEMKVQTCQREINVQRDVKFLENVGMSKPTCQQPTYMSMPSTIYDENVSNKVKAQTYQRQRYSMDTDVQPQGVSSIYSTGVFDQILSRERSQTYQREDVKLLENDRIPKTILQQQTCVPYDAKRGISKDQGIQREENVWLLENDSASKGANDRQQTITDGIKRNSPTTSATERYPSGEDDGMSRGRERERKRPKNEGSDLGNILFWTTLIVGGLLLVEFALRN